MVHFVYHSYMIKYKTFKIISIWGAQVLKAYLSINPFIAICHQSSLHSRSNWLNRPSKISYWSPILIVQYLKNMHHY